MYDVIIVGAGMAGLTAAIYTARADKKVLVLEGKVTGGQITASTKVANYPGILDISGADLMKNVATQAKNFGAEIKREEVLNITDGEIKKVHTDMGEYSAKNIILAVGSIDKKLDIPRETEMVGKGISYCTTCDGDFYKGKSVAIVGGGNSALYGALYLSDIAAKVYLIHRRENFRGNAMLVDMLRTKGNVEVLLNKQPAKILGNDKVEGLELDDGSMLGVDGIFVAIGKEPDTKKFADLVNLDKNGYIITDENCKTSSAGIFAVGDCRNKNVRQLVTAAADGAIAASGVLAW